MMRTIVVLGWLVLLTATSCGEKGAEQATVPIEINVDLDNGQRWAVNPETNTGVANLTEAVHAFLEQKDESAEAFLALKETLEEEFRLIFANCTMEGEAHNQLHNYLFPMSKLFKKLGDSDASVRSSAIEELEAHLNAYNTYFE